MRSNVGSPILNEPSSDRPETEASPGARPRVIAVFALVMLALGVSWVVRGIYFAMTDAWMAPITLSVDNDQVLQINVKLNEQQVQRERMRVDIERIAADVQGIDEAISKLREIENNARESLRWARFTTRSQSAAAADRLRALEQQQRLIDAMLARQQQIASNVTKSSEAGLVSRQEVERERQILDQLTLGRVQNAREMTESRAQSAQLFAMNAALMIDASGGRDNGIPSELAIGQERDARITLELIRLASERRALLAQRSISMESLSRMDDLLKQLRARPLYRAVEANTDIAFVPYTQLDDVSVGAAVVSCKWVLFRCRTVGRVAEIVPGEVAAQDPWSELARGQYVVLDLSLHDAVKEKVLRARAAH